MGSLETIAVVLAAVRAVVSLALHRATLVSIRRKLGLSSCFLHTALALIRFYNILTTHAMD